MPTTNSFESKSSLSRDIDLDISRSMPQLISRVFEFEENGQIVKVAYQVFSPLSQGNRSSPIPLILVMGWMSVKEDWLDFAKACCEQSKHQVCKQSQTRLNLFDCGVIIAQTFCTFGRC